MGISTYQTGTTNFDVSDPQMILDEDDPNDSPIPFFIYITNFIDLLERAHNKRVEWQHKVVMIIKKHFDSVVTFFKHIFTKPLIDPSDPTFIDVLDRFSARLSVLKEEVNDIPQMFHNRTLLSSDLQKMYHVHHQVDETLNQLKVFLAEVREYKVPLPIEQDISTLTEAYQELRNKLKNELARKERGILEAFIGIYEFLSPYTINIPKESRKELVQCGTIMAETLHPDTPLKRRFLEIFERLKSGERTDIPNARMIEESNVKGMVATAPLVLRNYNNSCYFHAALQALFCIDEARRLAHQNLKDPPLPARELTLGELEERKRHLNKRKEIQAYLLNTLKVLTPQQESDFSHLQHVLTVAESRDIASSPSNVLRERVFMSGLVPDYTMNYIDQQRDPQPLVEFLMQEILCQPFFMQKVWTTQAAPGRAFLVRKEEFSALQISLKPDHYKLQDLIDSYFTPEVSSDEKTFIPSEGVVVNPAEAAEVVKPEFTIPVPIRNERDAIAEAANQAREPVNKRYRVSEFEIVPQLLTLPDIMAVQLVRFRNPGNGVMEKNTTPILLPSNGRISFEKNYEPEESTEPSSNTEYEIMGYLIHHGVYAGGHYTAKVKIGDKYFRCDDADPRGPYQEITASDFYNEKQPYVVFLRRLKEVDKIKD